MNIGDLFISETNSMTFHVLDLQDCVQPWIARSAKLKFSSWFRGVPFFSPLVARKQTLSTTTCHGPYSAHFLWMLNPLKKVVWFLRAAERFSPYLVLWVCFRKTQLDQRIKKNKGGKVLGNTVVVYLPRCSQNVGVEWRLCQVLIKK